jgi:hypothetical protein
MRFALRLAPLASQGATARGLSQPCVRRTLTPKGAEFQRDETLPAPDALWQVFGDPANPWMPGLMLVSLAGAVAGPWAMIRFVVWPTEVRGIRGVGSYWRSP